MTHRRAQELLLLGDRVSGRDAAHIGLITRSFAKVEELETHLDTVLTRLEFCSPVAYAQTKACLSAAWNGSLEHGEGVELEAELQSMSSGDFVKALAAMQSRQRHNFAMGRDEPRPAKM